MTNPSIQMGQGPLSGARWLHCLVLGLLLAAGLMAVPTDGQAKEDYSFVGIKDASQVPKFVASLQKALAADDKNAVAGMVSYPLMVSIGGEDLEIADKAAFVSQYDRILTKEIKQNILAQPLNDIFVNKQGVMVGSDGKVWALPDGKALRIAVIRD
ncbi:hypothetical protein [Desulfovibrio sp. DV]|uniref:hypothetical protein n=1 Tax=Desulfovibrio sp. DV TaxID=1844708 RepID=UPI00094B8656|nr:hypothetical protein [Desulfovibrio sp. DV]